MHDRNGKSLTKGDVVLVPCVVTEVMATEDYCNVQLTTVFGRRPDDAKETIYAINTGVVLRINEGDDKIDATSWATPRE